MTTKLKRVSLNKERQLYVIPEAGGYSCLGFTVLEERYERLSKECIPLNFQVPECKRFGTLARYKQYQDLLKFCRELHKKTGRRFNAELHPRLTGLEGSRVEVIYKDGTKTRFWVGKSAGWIPIHLEIKRSNSRGGISVYLPDDAKLRIIERKL